MLIKLDEHIPHRLVAVLSAMGHDVDTVDAEGLQGVDDISSGRQLRKLVGS